MTSTLAPRSPRASFTQMTELVLPQHSNVLGTAFGGTVLAWMDVCGAMSAAGFRNVRHMPFEEMPGALARQYERWRFPWTVIVGEKP